MQIVRNFRGIEYNEYFTVILLFLLVILASFFGLAKFTESIEPNVVLVSPKFNSRNIPYKN